MSNWGLEDFATYASRRENQSVPIHELRRIYDAAVEKAKVEQKRQNDETRERRLKALDEAKKTEQARRTPKI